MASHDIAVAEPDGRRRRGDQSRRAILATAVQLASAEGLEALSLARLAEHRGSSKSGVAALFGSKLALQLATIETARELFIDAVVQPALAAPKGLPRLWALCTLWLDYSQGRVFDGGCFFRAVGAEVDSRDGELRDAVAEIDAQWQAFVRRAVEEASPQLPALDDAELLAFRLVSYLTAANAASLLQRTDRPYALAREAARTALLAAGADPAALA